MGKIIPSTVNHALVTYQGYCNAVEEIRKRVDYIITHCANVFNATLDWWDWQNEGFEDAPGDFIHSYDPNTLNINVHWEHKEDMNFVNKDGEVDSLSWGEFPTRWLYEDFEEELTNGIKLWQDKLKAKKNKAAEKRKKDKEDKAKLIASAKAKLTPNELKAIKNANK